MKTLVWDVDDVLNDLMKAWFERHWRPHHPECQIGYEQLYCNPPDIVLGISRAAYLDSLDQFHHQMASDGSLTPAPELLAWFEAFGAGFRHIALTARPLAAAPSAAAWVMRHFGRWIRVFAVAPSRLPDSGPNYDSDKGSLLRWLGAGDVLIDDNEANLALARAAGLASFLWPQPWNSASEGKQQVLKCLQSWLEEQ